MWLGRAAWELLAEADGIVPVPLHRWRLLKRRYNQAAEIARPLAARAGVRYLPDVLVRPRSTGSQGGKSASGRRRNVAAAFVTPEAKRRQVEGRRLLLVDDVMTTGATAEGCARALLRAGAAAVDVAVVARVREVSSL
jgi:ComF family protein